MNTLNTTTPPTAAMPDVAVAGRLTVNAILERWPAAVGPLNECGIDTCCGGSNPLDEAARDAGVSLSDLWHAIVVATSELR